MWKSLRCRLLNSISVEDWLPNIFNIFHQTFKNYVVFLPNNPPPFSQLISTLIFNVCAKMIIPKQPKNYLVVDIS